MDSEEKKYREDLFEEICAKLRATDTITRAHVQKWIDEIALNLERNKAEAESAKGALTLGEARSQLDAHIKILEKHSEYLDKLDPLLLYGSTATDNPHADPAIRERSAERQLDTSHKQQAAKAANEALLADVRRRRENPSWENARGTIPSMEVGTPASNFAADCVKMFEYFRPDEMSWKPESDLYIVAANIYELSTGRSLLEENADFSLEHYLRKAVEQLRRTVRGT